MTESCPHTSECRARGIYNECPNNPETCVVYEFYNSSLAIRLQELEHNPIQFRQTWNGTLEVRV